MKNRKIDCKMNSYSENVNDNLMRVKIVVMHDKTNLNGTKFSKDCMEKAENTIKNIPILGHVIRDSYGDLEDFDTHNMETRIIDGDNGFDIETYYIEKPIGVVPESCNPRYEEIDGYTYLVVDGYIWKSYSNGSYKLIANNEFKGVSMEISVQEGQYDENDYTYEILDYQYEGITVLGDHTPAAMGEHTKISKYAQCSDYKKALEEICNEIYSLESEVSAIDNQSIEIIEDIQNNTVIEDTIESLDEINIENESDSDVVENEDIEATDEVVTIIEDEENKSTIITTSESISINVESKDIETEEVISESPLDVFSILFDEVPGSLSEIAVKLHERFSIMDAQLKELEKFKSDRDRELKIVEVDEIISEYAEISVDEIEDIRNDAVDSKLELNLFREKLASLAYQKIKANKGNYSYNSNKVIVPIIEKNEENGYEPYGGIFK